MFYVEQNLSTLCVHCGVLSYFPPKFVSLQLDPSPAHRHPDDIGLLEVVIFTKPLSLSAPSATADLYRVVLVSIMCSRVQRLAMAVNVFLVFFPS